MKQTNNAIKFLMAQYRAIFQNAYFKGLATAAVVTMGLAAGQAQAAAANLANDTDLSGKTGPIVIMGDSSSDGTDNKWNNLTLSGGTIADKGMDITISGGAIADNFFKHDGTTTGNATYSSENTLTINGADNTKGLSILSAADSKGITVTFGEVEINKGSIALNSAAKQAATASLAAGTITIGNGKSATNSDAQIQLHKNGSVGTAFSGDDVFGKLSTINLKSGGTITTVFKADADTSTINAGTLNISGGDLKLVDNGSNKSGTTVALNLVKGSLSNGSISLGATSALNINFKKALTEANGAAETNTLALTGGSISGAGAIVVSGDGTTGTLTLKVKSGETVGVDLANASGDLKIASGAIFETDKANLDNLAASSLKTTISGGILKFTDEANINLTTDGFNGDGSSNKIGLSNNATILGNEFTLTNDIGAVTVEASKLNLKNSTTNALSDTAVKASKTLVVGAESKVKTVTLLAGDLAKIKKQVDDANHGLGADALKAKYAEALLSQSGDIASAEGVSEGKLTISGASSALNVVNGTWTNDSVHVVLGEGSNSASLNVGPEVTAPTGLKNAASLTFGDGSKLTIASGAVAVGNSTSTTLVGATLDISALDTAEEFTFTKGSITADKNGTIIADSSLLGKLNTSTKIDVNANGTLTLVGDAEIKASNLAGSSTNNKLFVAANGNLVGDTLTIKGASVALVKDANVKANTLVLDNYNDSSKKYEAVTLTSGNYIASQGLRSTQSGLLLTVGQDANVTLGTLSQDADGAWSADTQTGTSNFKYKLNDAAAALNVNAGTWTLNTAQKADEFDIDLTNGALTVGDDGKRDANGDLVGATLVAGKVNQTADGKITINEGSKATFTEFKSLGTAEKTLVNGTLTLVGKETAYVAANPNATPAQNEVLASYGVSLNNVKVSGPTAVLELQKTALGAIDSIAKKDQDPNTKVTVNYKQNKPTGGADLGTVKK